jgi:hypothetical protein
MVDSTTFLTWLIQQMATCNLAQAGFVTRLADSYLDDMLTTRALTRPFVDACFTKLLEVVFLLFICVPWTDSYDHTDTHYPSQGVPPRHGGTNQNDSSSL